MKGTAKIFVIISMITCTLSGLSNLLMSDLMLEVFREILAPIEAELGAIDLNQMTQLLKTSMIISGIISIVGCLAVGAYALWALKNGQSKRSIIAPGVLLIVFGNLFGIIAAIIMFCIKPEEFEPETEIIE